MKTYNFKINGKDYAVTIGEADGRTLPVNVNGADYQVELENAPQAAPVAAMPSPGKTPDQVGSDAAKAGSDAAKAGAAPVAKPAGAGEKVNSPLPGVIIEVSVKEGQAVKAGQKLAVLEAMKMENEIPAPKDGTVTAIHVSKGDSVLEGAPIVSIA
ncbi:MAG: biotin/lipoyl-binding protein [Bacteroidales bacterium]|nr:biotin/lipoyl-binding protein [Bacteroidales bacterium]